MAEILTHVLIAFALFTAGGWLIEWFDRKWVAVAAVGTIFPDLNRFDLLIDGYFVSSTLGIPFDWDGLHTLGGVFLLSALGAVPFAAGRVRRRAFGVLLSGAVLHLLVDAVKLYADGFNGMYLYPLSWWRNPTPGLYVSAERWVLLLSILLAGGVLVVDYLYRSRL